MKAIVPRFGALAQLADVDFTLPYDAYPCFTVAEDMVTTGIEAVVTELKVGAFVPAIVIGEVGRGRWMSLITATRAGSVTAARIGETRSGVPKLLACAQPNSPDYAIVLFRQPIGAGGANEYTGDRLSHEPRKFDADPCRVLAAGIIAEGDSGREGSGTHQLVLLPRGAVMRTGFGGRRLGRPLAYY